MKIERQEVGTVEILAPQGVLAEDDASEFSALVQERLAGANPRIVISLHEVPYMDSAALNGLVQAADEMIDRGTRLKLVSVSATCREILELTGLSRRFQFFEDPQDAVRSFL
ncbi:MAG: STAS domain-containing protein [Planctomycetota bacterium]|jgi:anti-anti-sigma factor